MTNTQDTTTREIPAAGLQGAGSHSVTLDHGRPVKEEVYLRFITSWRGAPAIVTMRVGRSVSRYFDEVTGASVDRFGDWRAWATEAQTIDQTDESADWRRGSALTETARHRLSDQHEAESLAWVESAAGAVSHKKATAYAIKGMFYDLRPSFTDPTREIRRVLGALSGEMFRADAEAIAKAVRAFDRFAEQFVRIDL